MKIFLSHSSKIDYQAFYEAIRGSEISIRNEIFYPHGGGSEVINTKETIKGSDLVLAEVSLPSTGQGIEIGWANDAEKRIILFYKKGQIISSSLKLLSKEIIEYEGFSELVSKLNILISGD